MIMMKPVQQRSEEERGRGWVEEEEEEGVDGLLNLRRRDFNFGDFNVQRSTLSPSAR
jgi:hypothetical protein